MSVLLSSTSERLRKVAKYAMLEGFCFVSALTHTSRSGLVNLPIFVTTLSWYLRPEKLTSARLFSLVSRFSAQLLPYASCHGRLETWTAMRQWSRIGRARLWSLTYFQQHKLKFKFCQMFLRQQPEEQCLFSFCCSTFGTQSDSTPQYTGLLLA